MVGHSSNQCLEFITCKSLELKQSMKCQLALQHIHNNNNNTHVKFVCSGNRPGAAAFYQWFKYKIPFNRLPCFSFIPSNLFIMFATRPGNPFFTDKTKLVNFPLRLSRCLWGTIVCPGFPEYSLETGRQSTARPQRVTMKPLQSSTANPSVTQNWNNN